MECRVYNTVFGRIQTGKEATVEDVIRYLMFRGRYEETVSTFNLKDSKIIEIDELFSTELIKEAVEELKNRRKKKLKLHIEELQFELDKL